MTFDDDTSGSSDLQSTWAVIATQEPHIEGEGDIAGVNIPATLEELARERRQRTWRRRRNCRTTMFRRRDQAIAASRVLWP